MICTSLLLCDYQLVFSNGTPTIHILLQIIHPPRLTHSQKEEPPTGKKSLHHYIVYMMTGC